MTTFDSGTADVPLLRKRSALALAVAALAVVGFVAVSLALKSAAHLALVSFGLLEDSYGQCGEYILVTGVSMFAVRKGLDLTAIKYNGRIIFYFFLSISILVMAFALSSGFMKVDFLISLLQMSALCLFAYLQFWARDGHTDADYPA